MTKPTSLWIIKQYAVSPDLPGNTRHFELARRLVERGYDVTIFATSFHYSQHEDLKLAPHEDWRTEKVDGVNFVWVRTFPFQRNDWRRAVHMLSFMSRVYRLGRRLTRKRSQIVPPDVVIGCSVPPFAALAGYGLARRFQSRFFFEVGDLWPQTLIDMGALSKTHPVARALGSLERFLYRRAEWIITPLPCASGYIEEAGANADKIVWIPNGADDTVLRLDRNSDAHDGRFTVLYLGVHSETTALEDVLEAAKILQDNDHADVTFRFIGDGPSKPALLRMAEHLELTNVEFVDSVPKSQIAEHLQRADVALITFKDAPVFENYGIASKKLFDYLGAGLPIIFSVHSAYNPIREAGCGVTVPPGDAAALARAVVELSQMPEAERQSMGERARHHARQYHEWSGLAERLATLIEANGERQQPVRRTE